jgi:hypothetical protein
VFVVNLAAWHLPALYTVAQGHTLVHYAEHVLSFGTATTPAPFVFHARRRSDGGLFDCSDLGGRRTIPGLINAFVYDDHRCINRSEHMPGSGRYGTTDGTSNLQKERGRMRTYNQQENAGVVALVGLGLVLVAGVVTVWWWSHAVWGDISLSFLDNLAPYVSYSDTRPPDVGYQPNAVPTAEPRQPAATIEQTAGASPAPAAAASCPPGQAASFVLGFAELHQRLAVTRAQAAASPSSPDGP